jgi:hypothetical protein
MNNFNFFGKTTVHSGIKRHNARKWMSETISKEVLVPIRLGNP